MKIKLKEAKSLDDMMQDANRIKKELADVQKEYNKSKTETNKAKVEAKKGQLERVTNAIRNARANQRESVAEVVTEDVNWGTINNVFVKFLKANTKELEKRVNANDLEGTKAAIKSIISGLSNAQKSLKLEGVAKSTSLNEVTVTRIPNFNLESDAYIIMLYLLKNNSGFKKAATNAGIDLFSGANTKSVFAGLHTNLKKVITPQIIKAVVETINQDRKKIFIDDADIQKGVHTARFAGLLALGVVDSFINDPIDYKLINDLGNAKLKGLADEFSIGRGKIKLGAMLGNKGF
jgi:tetrahydromethanopterin S-methyltransferase subunit F